MDTATLVQDYTPLVYKEAHRAFRRVPRSAGLDVEDLAQEGWAEALYAVGKWDPSRLTGVQSEKAVFISYLTLVLRHRYAKLAKQGWAREGLWTLGEAYETPHPAYHSKRLLETILEVEQRPRARTRVKGRALKIRKEQETQVREALAEARRVAYLPDRYSPFP